MSDLINRFQLDQLRTTLNSMLGINDEGGNELSIEGAKTLITIRRVLDRGVINPTTKKYDAPVTEIVYTGPGDISPVTYRRDRQEQGGAESVRIRQYRGVVPWDADDIHLDDYLIVNFSTDPEMVGKILDITDVLYESELAVRRISLVDTSKDTTGLDC